MQKMTPEVFEHYLEARLTQWAEWYSRKQLSGLGYPSCSLEYRIMREGALIRSTVPHPLPSNRAAEEIEQCIVELKAHNADMAYAVRCHYFQGGSLRQKARYLSVSHMQFKAYLERGRAWLAGRLSSQPLLPLYV
jgi:hypothetical protein